MGQPQWNFWQWKWVRPIVSSTMTAIGTVDVYPGAEGSYGGDQPACDFAANSAVGTGGQLCSHFRAPHLFTASIAEHDKCQGVPPSPGSTTTVGYWMSQQASRSLNVETNEEFPYCL